MTDDIEIPLSITDNKDITSVLLSIIKSSTITGVLPVEFDYVSPKSACVALLSKEGARKSSVFIDGSYDGEFPFSIRVRQVQTNTDKRLDVHSMIEEYGDAFEVLTNSGTLPDLGGGRRILSIEQVSLSSLVFRDESGVEDYQGSFLLKFERED